MSGRPELSGDRDTMARVVRALEAIGDGELELGVAVLEDLAGDLWKVIEQEERGDVTRTAAEGER